MLILFGVGLAAGTLNILAGGGSMLTLPALILLGLPPTVANGTNRIAILAQNIAVVWSFSRRGLVDPKWLRTAAPPAIIGAILGTWTATVIDDSLFQNFLGFAMLTVAVYTVWDPFKHTPVGDHLDFATHPLGPKGLAVAFFLIGAWGGFIQVGVGFFILALAMAGGLNLVRGNALKVLLVLAFTIPALGLFAMAGKVDARAGLALAAGNVTGGLLGVRIGVAIGHTWIKRIVTVVVVVMALYLLLG